MIELETWFQFRTDRNDKFKHQKSYLQFPKSINDKLIGLRH